MIAIVNVSKNPEPTGEHDYEVRINREVITTFTHMREENLSVCLRKAAEAVEGIEKVTRVDTRPIPPFFE